MRPRSSARRSRSLLRGGQHRRERPPRAARQCSSLSRRSISRRQPFVVPDVPAGTVFIIALDAKDGGDTGTTRLERRSSAILRRGSCSRTPSRALSASRLRRAKGGERWLRWRTLIPRQRKIDSKTACLRLTMTWVSCVWRDSD